MRDQRIAPRDPMPEMQRITNLFHIRRQRKQYVGNPGGASRAGIGSREVVTTPIEHHSVGRACASLKNSGIAVYTLPVSEEGKNRFACFAAGPGTAAQIGDHSIRQQRGRHDSGYPYHFHPLSKKGVLLHVDAVQAIGHIPVVLDGIDFLSASAHKLAAPKA